MPHWSTGDFRFTFGVRENGLAVYEAVLYFDATLYIGSST